MHQKRLTYHDNKQPPKYDSFLNFFHYLSCLKHLGGQHENLAVSLVPELLSTHPFFATSEPDVDDPAYVGMVVIVLNAALNSPTIVPILPPHTRRHYYYLRDKYPELLPVISLGTKTSRACGLNTRSIGRIFFH